MMKTSRTALAALLVLSTALGCAYQVIPVGDPAPEFSAPSPPIPLTLAVVEGGFDNSSLDGEAITEHFASELRDTRLFQGVMHPVPGDARPLWQLEISANDAGHEPNANFWKSFLSNVLPPLLFVVHLENDYTLNLEALLLRERKLVETYRASVTIRHRYQAYAPKAQMQAEALDLLARTATRQVLSEVAADAERLKRLN